LLHSFPHINYFRMNGFLKRIYELFESESVKKAY